MLDYLKRWGCDGRGNTRNLRAGQCCGNRRDSHDVLNYGREFRRVGPLVPEFPGLAGTAIDGTHDKASIL